MNSQSNFDIDAAIKARRTSMHVDPARLVDSHLISELCEISTWAPCHKRTWPWRFAVVEGPARRQFGDVVADAMRINGDDAERVTKARTKYMRTPTVVVVGSASGDSPTRTLENRDATAAAVQNFLLAATARGLATYWSSSPRNCNEAVSAFCGFDDASIVAIIYVGWADREIEPPSRPKPEVHWIADQESPQG